MTAWEREELLKGLASAELLTKIIDAAVKDAVENEREACAKVADGYGSSLASDVTGADVIAAAIRGRK